MCECKHCRRFIRAQAALAADDLKELKSLVEELANDLAYAEDDAGYYRAILSGSWPSADEVLKRWRLKRVEGQ